MRSMDVSSTGAAVASRLAAALLIISAAAVTAQETNEFVLIDFRNRIPGIVDAPVYDFDGVSGLDGSIFLAYLAAGPDTNSFNTWGPAHEFLTGTNAGYWQYDTPVEIRVPILGQPMWFQVWIFELLNTFPFPTPVYAGSGKAFSVTVTTNLIPLVGLESFKLVPEQLQITVAGDQSVIQWEYLAASRYELHSTSDLKPPVSWTPIFEWSPVESGYPPSHYLFSVTNVVTHAPQFYRLERWRQTRD